MTVTQTYDAAFPVADLIEHPGNPRRGDEAAIDASMQAHGFYGAVLAQAGTRRIIAGNHRARVAKRRGETTVPVLFLDVDDDQAARILVVDNRTNDLAVYDDLALAALLEGLAGTDLTLTGTGFSDADLEALLEDLAPPDPDMPKPGDERYTPAWVFDGMGLVFDMDVAAPVEESERRTPARRFLTVHDDGLATDWAGLVWMNPPYSKAAPWARKWMQHPDGVCLVSVSSSWVNEMVGVADCFAFTPVVDFTTPVVGEDGGIAWPTIMASRGAGTPGLRRLAAVQGWPLCTAPDALTTEPPEGPGVL